MNPGRDLCNIQRTYQSPSVFGIQEELRITSDPTELGSFLSDAASGEGLRLFNQLDDQGKGVTAWRIICGVSSSSHEVHGSTEKLQVTGAIDLSIFEGLVIHEGLGPDLAFCRFDSESMDVVPQHVGDVERAMVTRLGRQFHCGSRASREWILRSLGFDRSGTAGRDRRQSQEKCQLKWVIGSHSQFSLSNRQYAALGSAVGCGCGIWHPRISLTLGF